MKRFTEELQSAATAGDDIISHKFTSALHRLQIAGKVWICVQHPVNFLKTLQK